MCDGVCVGVCVGACVGVCDGACVGVCDVFVRVCVSVMPVLATRLISHQSEI